MRVLVRQERRRRFAAFEQTPREAHGVREDPRVVSVFFGDEPVSRRLEPFIVERDRADRPLERFELVLHGPATAELISHQ